ncbi:MAG: YigZ family protein [Oscillospiraceae bacterium]|nr:YigZ family protein [Oscillospiraceae bacterium]
MESYRVPTRDSETEFIEKKSRFIGRIWVVETEEEALARLKEMRARHWDATHNVFAYIIHGGPMRYSDDGEPQGTAGMPVLDVLRGQNLENVCCIVTRYFGGTLLGTGGLVRAYGKAARDAVTEAGISVKRLWQKLDLILPYTYYERLRQQTERSGGQILDTEYGADICLHVILPADAAEDYLARVTDLTAGTVQGIDAGTEFRAFPVSD